MGDCGVVMGAIVVHSCGVVWVKRVDINSFVVGRGLRFNRFILCIFLVKKES